MIIDLRESSQAVAVRVSPPPESLRTAAVGTWLGRMVHEYRSADVFEALASQLSDAGVAGEHVQVMRGFAAEERRHGVLCGAVVEALGGEARAHAAEPEPVPLHKDAHALEGALRNLLSVSCLSETVAVALIGAERQDMPEGPLRELLTGIWADECGHAHAGWQLVADLLPDDDALKERLGDYLEVALGHLEAHELSHLPEHARWPEGAEAWGLCSGEHARALFFETVEAVILPGLERLGLPARRAWRLRRAA